MVTRVRNYYKPDRKGVVSILTSQPMRGVLSRVGHKGAEIARGLAPVRTGRYATSFEVQVTTVYRGNRKRAAVIVANTAPYSASVEFGTQPSATPGGGTRPGTRPQRVLGRTQSRLRASGYLS